jgi:hypothetical protein
LPNLPAETAPRTALSALMERRPKHHRCSRQWAAGGPIPAFGATGRAIRTGTRLAKQKLPIRRLADKLFAAYRPDMAFRADPTVGV